jgi:hypothetical protein
MALMDFASKIGQKLGVVGDPNAGAGFAGLQRETLEKIAQLVDTEVDKLTIEDLQYSLKKPELVGLLEPEELENLKMTTVAADPRLKGVQEEGLAQLQELTKTGVTEEDRGALREIKRDVGARDQARTESILAEMAKSGTLDSGNRLATLLHAGQQSTQREAEAGDRLGRQIGEGRRDAMGKVANLARSMREQDIADQVRVAQAKDNANKFNLGTRMNTKRENLASRQNMLNAQIAMENKQRAQDVQAKKDLHGIQMGRAKFKAAPMTNMANLYGQRAAGESRASQERAAGNMALLKGGAGAASGFMGAGGGAGGMSGMLSSFAGADGGVRPPEGNNYFAGGVAMAAPMILKAAQGISESQDQAMKDLGANPYDNLGIPMELPEGDEYAIGGVKNEHGGMDYSGYGPSLMTAAGGNPDVRDFSERYGDYEKDLESDNFEESERRRRSEFFRGDSGRSQAYKGGNEKYKERFRKNFGSPLDYIKSGYEQLTREDEPKAGVETLSKMSNNVGSSLSDKLQKSLSEKKKSSAKRGPSSLEKAASGMGASAYSGLNNTSMVGPETGDTQPISVTQAPDLMAMFQPQSQAPYRPFIDGRPCADGGMAYEDGGEGTIIDSGMESYAGDHLRDRINDGEMVINVEQQDSLNNLIKELANRRMNEDIHPSEMMSEEMPQRVDEQLNEGMLEVNPHQQQSLMDVLRGDKEVEELPDENIVEARGFKKLLAMMGS